MFNGSVQQYFKNVIAWLWNIRFKRGDQAHLSIRAGGDIGMKRHGRTLEDGFVTVVFPYADTQEVVQLFAMN